MLQICAKALLALSPVTINYIYFYLRRWLAVLVVLAVGFLLTACSGEPNDSVSSSRKSEALLHATKQAESPAVLTLTAPVPAAVNVLSGQSQTQSEIQPQAATAISTATFSPVIRLQNTNLTGAYFFTIYNAERMGALAANPNWRQEGTAFWASTTAGERLSPVHRFRNKQNGSYLYTIYDAERTDIATNFATTFAYEGVAWYAQQTQSAGWYPLYRFRNLLNGTYLFSANEAEKDSIVANYASTFKLEGVAYYVWQDTVALAEDGCGITNFQTDMLAIINMQRAAGAVCRGVGYPAVGALAWNAQLQQAATAHVADMGSHDFFSHIGSDSSKGGQRISTAGYRWSTWGENIAAGQTTVAQVVAGWMSSSAGHCENIMNPAFRDLGVSCKTYPQSTYRNYWAMELGVR